MLVPCVQNAVCLDGGDEEALSDLAAAVVGPDDWAGGGGGLVVVEEGGGGDLAVGGVGFGGCLLYTSDAADDTIHV